jgi:hypothetical protein
VIGRISDHHADGRVGAEVLDVHVSLESVVPFLGKEEHGRVVLGTIGLRIQSPEKVITCVDDIVNLYLSCWLSSKGRGGIEEQ